MPNENKTEHDTDPEQSETTPMKSESQAETDGESGGETNSNGGYADDIEALDDWSVEHLKTVLPLSEIRQSRDNGSEFVRAVICSIRNPGRGLETIAEMAGVDRNQVVGGLLQLGTIRVDDVGYRMSDRWEARLPDQKATIDHLARHGIEYPKSDTDGSWSEIFNDIREDDRYDVGRHDGTYPSVVVREYPDLLRERRLALFLADEIEGSSLYPATDIDVLGVRRYLNLVCVGLPKSDFLDDRTDVLEYDPDDPEPETETEDGDGDGDVSGDEDEGGTAEDTERNMIGDQEFTMLPEGSTRDDVDPGVRYYARVNNVVNWGVFVTLAGNFKADNEVSGLVHRTVLPPTTDPDDFVREDEVVVTLREVQANGDLNFEMVGILDAVKLEPMSFERRTTFTDNCGDDSEDEPETTPDEQPKDTSVGGEGDDDVGIADTDEDAAKEHPDDDTPATTGGTGGFDVDAFANSLDIDADATEGTFDPNAIQSAQDLRAMLSSLDIRLTGFESAIESTTEDLNALQESVERIESQMAAIAPDKGDDAAPDPSESPGDGILIDVGRWGRVIETMTELIEDGFEVQKTSFEESFNGETVEYRLKVRNRDDAEDQPSE